MKLNDYKYHVYIKSSFADGWLVKGYNTMSGAQKFIADNKGKYGLDERFSIVENRRFKK